MSYPTISVIIPRRAFDTAEEAIQAVFHSDYPQHLIEIIEVIGENPSKQRNMGAEAASGDILYFLDNDSIVPPTLFSRIAKYYIETPLRLDEQLETQGTLAGVGGPNLTPKTDGFLQKISGYALASPFAHFNMCARYKPTGRMRYTGEKELILCNLSIRRDVFLREHGFNESMYPNEENEFINRLVEKGDRFLYDPDAYLYRSRRNRFLEFVTQLSHYGRGRAEQILVEGFSLKSLLFFLPTGLLGYVSGLFLLTVLGVAFWWTFLPLMLYSVLAIASALQFAIQERNPFLAVILPIWYLTMHLAYGAGMLYGFWKALRPAEKDSVSTDMAVEVVLRKALEKME